MMNKKEFKQKLNEKFGDKFIVVKCPERVRDNSEVVLCCPVHGDFRTTPASLFESHQIHGCPRCRKDLANRNYNNNRSKKRIEIERQVVLYTHEKEKEPIPFEQYDEMI